MLNFLNLDISRQLPIILVDSSGCAECPLKLTPLLRRLREVVNVNTCAVCTEGGSRYLKWHFHDTANTIQRTPGLLLGHCLFTFSQGQPESIGPVFFICLNPLDNHEMSVSARPTYF